MSETRGKVNLFIVGVAKGGTTSLANYLMLHQDVCIYPKKEANFFKSAAANIPGSGPGDEYTHSGELSLSEYERKFADKMYKLDASPVYMYDVESAVEIHKYNPQAKIICIARDPLERAISHYKHLLRDNRESLGFEEALEMEEERKAIGYEFSWHYKKTSMYSSVLEKYLELFSKNVLIISFSELSTSKTIERLEQFLGISLEKKQLGQSNKSGRVKNRYIESILFKPNWFKSALKNIIPRSISSKLMDRASSAFVSPFDVSFDDNNPRVRELIAEKESVRKIINDFKF